MTDSREILDLDVLFVGAGPASLAGALHLSRLIEKHNANLGEGESPLEPFIAILEKGKEVGSHGFSGAVLDPSSLKELFPDTWQEAPLEGEIRKERFIRLSEKKALSLPVPPPLKNIGKYVVSLGKLVKWMAPQVEAAGVEIFCGFAGQEILLEGDRVRGVRTGDQGINKEGQEKANFEPGMDIHTQVTVLGEGPRGTLTKQLQEKLAINAGRNAQVYGLGVKEIWEIPEGRLEPGEVIHSFGYPLDSNTYGGSFVYGMKDNQAIVGLVVGLDYLNPHLDPHQEFQRMKTHPFFRDLLEGGTMTHYGAKAVPLGGWFSMPRLAGEGYMVTGDSGGFLNAQKLKGIHLAIKSGMLAAETIFEGLKRGEMRESDYPTKVEKGSIRKELWPVRNFHQAFDHGQLAGMVQAGLSMVTGGRGWGFKDRLAAHPGHERMEKLDGPHAVVRPPVAFDGKLTFDKLGDVYNSGTAHEEDQPVHLQVSDLDLCADRCVREYGNPCVRFCPAGVYEMEEDDSTPSGKKLQINASNCVHCKTCDIMDPYQVINWVPPEGSGGPNYGRM